MRGAVPASLGPVKHGMICACLGRIALGVLLGLIGTAGPVAASPWTKPAASYYLNLSYARIRASTYFDSVGAVRDLSAPYSQQVLALYAEVGVVDRWLTVVADWQTLRSVSQEGVGSAVGVGDLRVGGRVGLLSGPIAVSTTVLAGVPIGDPAPSPQTAESSLALNLQTGSGDVFVEGWLEAGHAITRQSLQAYWLAGMGWRQRGVASRSGTAPTSETQRYDNQLLTAGEAGIRILRPGWERWWFSFRVGGLYPEGRKSGRVNSYSGLRAGTRYTELALGADARVAGELHFGGKVEGALGPREVPRTLHFILYAALQR